MSKTKDLEPEYTGVRSGNEISAKLRTLMSYPSVTEASFNHKANLFEITMYNGDRYQSADAEAFYKDGSFVRTVMPWQKGDYPRVDATPTQGKIREITDAMQDLLLYKNNKYGDSAINPIEIFTKHIKAADTKTAAILVRLDDKLSRVKNADTLRTNDICDLIGYLILLNVALGTTAEDIAKFKD